MFWEQVKKGIYFRGTGPNFEVNKDNIGKRTNFRFWGNRGIRQFISGETREQSPPWEGIIFCGCTAWFVLDQTGNHEIRFSRDTAYFNIQQFKLQRSFEQQASQTADPADLSITERFPTNGAGGKAGAGQDWQNT